MSISIFEAIRNRPNLYIKDIEGLFEKIDEVIISEGFRSTIQYDKVNGRVSLTAINYKYSVYKKLLYGNKNNNMVDDLTKMYSCGNIKFIGRCLFGYGVILNSISQELQISAWDGEVKYNMECINDNITKFHIDQDGIHGLSITAFIRSDFTKYFRKV